MSEKQLAPGKWFFIAGLPPTTTDSSLAAFIKQCGYEIPVERCSVKYFHGPKCCSGMISVPENEVADLLASFLTWMCSESRLDGAPVQFQHRPSRKGTSECHITKR